MTACLLAIGGLVAAHQETAILTPLEGPVWKLTEFAGTQAPRDNPKHRPYLQFAGGRVSGWDGCNRIAATYVLKDGGVVAFSDVAGPKMVCIYTGDIYSSFHDALKSAARFIIAGNQLELLDANGGRLAIFTATTGLAGTSWRLVQFQSADGSIVTPDERARYTLYLGYADQLFMRIDCNQASGSWTSPAVNQLEFGELAVTRAICPSGSMYDQIVSQWPSIQTFVLRGGHLFLSLMDGGTYEFEPSTRRLP
jgi:heat shock protein HslJ